MFPPFHLVVPASTPELHACGGLDQRHLSASLRRGTQAEAAVAPWGVRRPLRVSRPALSPAGAPGSSGYFFAMNVYFPLSSDSLSSQMTVHLPESVNFAFTAPFFVSYTAHTSSDLSETLHS